MLAFYSKQAAQCYHIGGMFRRAQEKADQHRETESKVTDGQITDTREKKQGENNLNWHFKNSC